MRLLTKEDRQKAQAADFASLESQGYTKETYKDLIFWSKTDTHGARTYYAMKTYKTNAAHPLDFKYYQSDEDRNTAKENFKKNFDRNQTYKAEQKAKGKQLSNQAQAAQAIREELKTAFPGIKFSVTSEGYSMGDNVNVRWEDGPTEAQVNEITDKYQEGRFNGMEDIYEYNNTREDIPQTKYLFTHRKMSEATTLPASAKVTGIERVKISEWESKDLLTYEAQGQTTTTKETPTYEPQEVKAGTVQIIDYSEKAIAVIGDTKPIKDKLKALGGKFNFRLSCGAGWIFSKSRLEAVTKALQSPVIPDAETVEAAAQEIEAAEMTIDRPSKTLEEAKERLNEEIKKTANFLGIEYPTKQEEPKQYKTIKAIEEAAEDGQVIDLTNLYDLVNEKPAQKIVTPQILAPWSKHGATEEPATFNYAG